MRRIVLLAVFALLVRPDASAAQDTPRFGVVMGYPAQVALLWKVSDRLAVRPEINWSRSSLESTTTTTLPPLLGAIPIPPTTTTTTSGGWQVGIGLSGLLYLSKGDALRTYVSPRFGYSRTSSTTDLGIYYPIAYSPVPPIAGGPTTTTTSSYAAAGSIGAQYELGKRFGVFGELGLSYSHSGDRSPSSISPFFQSDQTSWSLGVRSGVGVILFFGS